jgi:hypothetical protein
MIDGRRIRHRLATTTGVFCVLGTLLLLSSGVKVVRAEGGLELPASDMPLPEPAPHLMVPPAAPMPIVPSVGPKAGIVPENPVVPVEEMQPDVIVLNNRGYNYGPRRPQADPATEP